MRNRRRGTTILETMLAVMLVSIVAIMAVTLIQLGHRTYESLEKDSQESRELLRFANRLREAAHRATEVEVSDDGTQLVLIDPSGSLTRFQVSASAISMEGRKGDTLMTSDSFALPMTKLPAAEGLTSGSDALKQVDSGWRFQYDSPMKIIEANRGGNQKLSLKATLGLIAITQVEGDGNEQ